MIECSRSVELDVLASRAFNSRTKLFTAETSSSVDLLSDQSHHLCSHMTITTSYNGTPIMLTSFRFLTSVVQSFSYWIEDSSSWWSWVLHLFVLPLYKFLFYDSCPSPPILLPLPHLTSKQRCLLYDEGPLSQVWQPKCRFQLLAVLHHSQGCHVWLHRQQWHVGLLPAGEDITALSHDCHMTH